MWVHLAVLDWPYSPRNVCPGWVAAVNLGRSIRGLVGHRLVGMQEINAASYKSEAESDHLLEKAEMGRFLRICSRSLDARMKDGSIPFIKLGRSVRFDLKDVKRALKRL